MCKKATLLVFALLLCMTSLAQNHIIHDPDIQTVQVVAGDNWMELPLIKLDGRRTNDVLKISFDDMTHEYRRFTYKIEHCEADWTPSEELFESDYIQGFYDGLTIDDCVESINTQMPYTHYSMQIPNEHCQLKLSGNYKLHIYDDNDDSREMLTVCFMVLEEQAQVGMAMTTNTDIDNNREHQQINMQVKYSGINPIRPEQQIKTVVLKNRQWSTAKINPQWQYTNTQGLEWSHSRDLIFQAGNEYHKFETLSTSHSTMGIATIVWDGENYHALPWPVETSRNYVYNEDANGAFYIRNSDNYENDNTTEYIYVHYRFHTPEEIDGDIFIDGDFTNGRYDADYNQMFYNPTEHFYEAIILQKQGYYNYTLMQRLADGTLRHLPQDGNFYQTENSYQALIYYRGTTDRTDRLVGYGKIGGR